MVQGQGENKFWYKICYIQASIDTFNKGMQAKLKLETGFKGTEVNFQDG